MQAPILVAAVEQIHDDRLRHDGHADIADRKTAARFAQPGLYAAGRIEAEGRAAGQHEGIDLADGHGRVEKIGVAAAGCPAEHAAGRGGRSVEDDGRDTGTERQVGGMADGNALDIGEKIMQCAQDAASRSKACGDPSDSPLTLCFAACRYRKTARHFCATCCRPHASLRSGGSLRYRMPMGSLPALHSRLSCVTPAGRRNRRRSRCSACRDRASGQRSWHAGRVSGCRSDPAGRRPRPDRGLPCARPRPAAARAFRG